MGSGENVNSGFPWFKFFPADYLNDSQLAMAPLAVQGLWMRVICHSYRTNEPGKLVGSSERLVRLLGCTGDELRELLQEARVLKFAEVRECADGRVEIISRRMVRDQKAREDERQAAAERQRRRRRAVTPDVTGAVTLESDPDPDLELERDSKPNRESVQRRTSHSPGLRPRSRKKPLPKEFKLDEEMRAFALSIGREDPTGDFELFCNNALAHGYEYANWRAAFYKFLRTQFQFEPNGQPSPLPPLRVAAQTAKPKLPQDLGRPGFKSTMVWDARILGIVRDEVGAWRWDPDRDYDTAVKSAAVHDREAPACQPGRSSSTSNAEHSQRDEDTDGNVCAREQLKKCAKRLPRQSGGIGG